MHARAPILFWTRTARSPFRHLTTPPSLRYTAAMSRQKPASCVDLGYRPNAWQRECHLASASEPRLAVATHRQAGKTTFAIMHVIDAALHAQAGVFALIVPEERHRRANMWPALTKWVAPLVKHKVAEIHDTRMAVRVQDAWIEVLSASDPDSLRGMSLAGWIAVEADMMNEAVADVLLPCLYGPTGVGWAVLIGSLCQKPGWLSAAFNKPEWTKKVFPVTATNVLPQDAVEHARRALGDRVFALEFLCERNG